MGNSCCQNKNLNVQLEFRPHEEPNEKEILNFIDQNLSEKANKRNSDISDQNSFVFLLNMPYEDRNIVLANKTVLLTLPDGTRLPGTIGTVFPNVDSLTQTQTITISVHSPQPIPQNLIARVHILRNVKKETQTIDRNAVLSDDAQAEFWVMKMINDSTAVKTVVKKGMEDGKSIQILSPVFAAKDRLITIGNYGLADTAKVKITR